jgi:hypothetical protein
MDEDTGDDNGDDNGNGNGESPEEPEPLTDLPALPIG